MFERLIDIHYRNWYVKSMALAFLDVIPFYVRGMFFTPPDILNSALAENDFAKKPDLNAIMSNPPFSEVVK